jgi:hypothetical protein
MKIKPLLLFLILIALSLAGCAGSKSKTTTDTSTIQSSEAASNTVTKAKDSSEVLSTTTVQETGSTTRKGVDTTATLISEEGLSAVLVTPDLTVVATRYGNTIRLRAVIPERKETYTRAIQQTTKTTAVKETATEVDAVARFSLNSRTKTTEITKATLPWYYAWWFWFFLIILVVIIVLCLVSKHR